MTVAALPGSSGGSTSSQPISAFGWTVSALVVIGLYQVKALRPWVGGLVVLVALGILLSHYSTIKTQIGGILHG